MRTEFLDMPLFYDWYGTPTNRLRKITYTTRRLLGIFAAVQITSTLNREELFGVRPGCLMLTNVTWEGDVGTQLEFTESMLPRSMLVAWTELVEVDDYDEGWSFQKPITIVPYETVDYQAVLGLGA